MAFTTKLDYSNNRQIKQHIETFTLLSGGTVFGVTFNDLPTGPNETTSAITETYTLVASTFSGNNTTTNFNWYHPLMELGHPQLSAITPSNSGETQTALPAYSATAFTTIDGNVAATEYTGSTFDITVITMTDLGGGNYTGTLQTEELLILSAQTADFTGRTIWNDVKGISRTERLIVTNNPQVGYVLTCADIEGMAEWAPSSGGGGGTGDTYVTGGTFNAGTAIFTNNTGGTFNVTGWRFSGGTGLNSQATVNGNNLASGTYSTAEGLNTIASGNLGSHTEGSSTTASGPASHAEGLWNIASGNYAHAEGANNKALGTSSHVEGQNNVVSASTFGAHAEGDGTIASGTAAHSEGTLTVAGGSFSHAQGWGSRAIGEWSHAGGLFSEANGDGSFASGNQAIANGSYSFIHGTGSTVNGNYSIVLGRGITGNTADTTYVDSLNIKTIPAGTPINNLGYDAAGRVVQGTTGGAGTNYWSAGTGVNAISVINFNGLASGDYSIADGRNTTASGICSLAQNSGTTASGQASFASGAFTIAGGDGAHAEGGYTTASGFFSHAQGYGCVASNEFCHAEGSGSIASGHTSHAEGTFCIAGGSDAHAQGFRTSAYGYGAHSGGLESQANGIASFVHGSGSTVNGNYSIVLGRFITGNTADTTYVDGLNIKTIPAGPGVTDIGVDANGFVVNQASDIRLKENINTIENALEKVMNLRGVTYNWKDRAKGGNELRVGFIAQEVQEVMSELTTNTGEYLGVQYKDVPALLVEAIKELVDGNTEYSKKVIETQTIQAEDNNIELNFNGSKATSINGGIKVLNTNNNEGFSDLTINENGDWITNTGFEPKAISIPFYTPTSSNDESGNIGNVTRNDDYLYIKTANGWKRSSLESF